MKIWPISNRNISKNGMKSEQQKANDLEYCETFLKL